MTGRLSQRWSLITGSAVFFSPAKEPPPRDLFSCRILETVETQILGLTSVGLAACIHHFTVCFYIVCNEAILATCLYLSYSYLVFIVLKLQQHIEKIEKYAVMHI